MKRSLRGLFSILMIMLTGCSGGLVGSGAGGRVVTIPRGYQDVYRDVRRYAKQCHEAGLITAEMKVDAELYTDIKRAEIRVYVLGGLGRNDSYGVDFEAAGQTQTTMTIREGLYVPNARTLFDKIENAGRGQSAGTC